MNDTGVLFVGDLARILRTSRATIDRMRRAGVFPIPELPMIDRRPRWSRAVVERYINGQMVGRGLPYRTAS